MVRRTELASEHLTVGTSAVTVTSAIPANMIRAVYRLKLSNLSDSVNKLHMDGLKGSTVTAVDKFPLSPKEVQDWPGYEVTPNSLPFWQFEEALYDHIQFTAEAASVEVYIQYADEHA